MSEGGAAVGGGPKGQSCPSTDDSVLPRSLIRSLDVILTCLAPARRVSWPSASIEAEDEYRRDALRLCGTEDSTAPPSSPSVPRPSSLSYFNCFPRVEADGSHGSRGSHGSHGSHGKYSRTK